MRQRLKQQQQQGSRRYQISPAVCNPPLMPIIDSPNACNHASAPIVCTQSQLHGLVQFSIHTGVRLVGHVSPKLPLPLQDHHPHVTRCSSGQAHSRCHTKSRLVQPFLYGPQMLCRTMHCQWGRKPQKLPHFPRNLCHPARGGSSHGHRQHAQKFSKDLASCFGDILVDRQTHRHTRRPQLLPQTK